MRNIETFIALNRFGLGMSAADIANTQGAPRDWVKAQVSRKFLRPHALIKMPSAASVLADYYYIRATTENGDPKRKVASRKTRNDFNAAQTARITHKITTAVPVVERFTQFWANHFTISRTRGLIGPAIPAYETEAIRPHIFDKFETLLLATVTHPGMLIYLDNIVSVGPKSRRGRRRGKNLNENLAREVLELHTLGAKGGYSQKDIVEFAKVLTGWTVKKTDDEFNSSAEKRTPAGGTIFNTGVHEPGRKTILGKTYSADGGKELVAVLRDLAVHPSTAKFIATKMAKHFISDTPAQADIDALAKVYTDTGGDLTKVTLALIDLDSVWASPLPKLKTPEDLVLAVMRADTSAANPRRKIKRADLTQSLKAMGQEPFKPPSPAGWPEETDRWLSPESLIHRIEWVRAYASKMSPTVNPQDLFEVTIAPATDNATRRMIKGAPSREDALALIFASSAFQRR